MRMIKSPEELQLARHAGEVAGAMMRAGRAAIGDGVPEYQVALATSRAGTLKAAELLEAHYPDAPMSPNTHFLQIMASGKEITKPHHRASTRIMRRGEPVFLCFCGMTNFHRFKLGFDRTFWIGRDRRPETGRDLRGRRGEPTGGSRGITAGGDGRVRACRLCRGHSGGGIQLPFSLRTGDGLQLPGETGAGIRGHDRVAARHGVGRRWLGQRREDLQSPGGR